MGALPHRRAPHSLEPSRRTRRPDDRARRKHGRGCPAGAPTSGTTGAYCWYTPVVPARRAPGVHPRGGALALRRARHRRRLRTGTHETVTTSPPRPDPTQSATAGATWSATPRPTASCPATPTARRTSSSAASTGARCSGTVPLVRRGATGAGVGRLVGPSWPHEPPAFFAPVPPQGAARRDRVLRTAGCSRPRTRRCRRRGRASSPARASPRGCRARRRRPR